MTMKKTGNIVSAATLLVVLAAAPSFAEREETGRVLSMNGSHIVIEIAGGEKLRLDVTERTKFYLEETTVRIKRILPDSKVRVSYQDGRASAIHIKAVPK